nr:uncharacterized protein LOC110374060 isoform X2 [Helicoverpa armigera]
MIINACVFICYLFSLSLSIEVSFYKDDDYFFEGIEPTEVGKHQVLYQSNEKLDMVIYFVNISPGSTFEVIETYYRGKNTDEKKTTFSNKNFVMQKHYVISTRTNFTGFDVVIQEKQNSFMCEKKTIVSGFLSAKEYGVNRHNDICLEPNSCTVVVNMKNECTGDVDTQKVVIIGLFSTALVGVLITLLTKSIVT